MFACTVSVAILAALNERPTLAEIISWIEVETLTLLFSMMVFVTILSDTGVIDYMSVLAYKLTGGKVWPLITTLCLFTSLISCLLDNVTTTLLMTPVTIRLCEMMKIDAVPVLIFMVIYSNLGGAVTPIGDPPNVIISSNPSVRKSVRVTTISFLLLIIFIVGCHFWYFYTSHGNWHDYDNNCCLFSIKIDV